MIGTQIYLSHCKFISEAAAVALIEGGAALAAGATTAGINAGATAVANRKSYKYTKKMTDYQNLLNLRNWVLQNEYNLPKNQMKRYQDAGLNPNLIYGQQNTAGDVGSVSTSQFDVKSMQAPNLDPASAISSYLAARRLAVDEKRADSQIDMNTAKIQEILDTLPHKVEKLIQDVVIATERAKNAPEYYSEQARSLNLSNQIKKIQIDSGFYQLQSALLKTKDNYMQQQMSYMNTQKEFLRARIAYQNWYNEFMENNYSERWTLDNEYKRKGISYMRRRISREGLAFKSDKDAYNYSHKWLSEYGFNVKSTSLPAIIRDAVLGGTYDIYNGLGIDKGLKF